MVRKSLSLSSAVYACFSWTITYLNQEHNRQLFLTKDMFNLLCVSKRFRCLSYWQHNYSFTYQTLKGTKLKWTYSDSLELELVVERFEGRDLLVERREVGRENTLETGGQVVLPPHLPHAEHTVLTAQKLHTHTNIPDIIMNSNRFWWLHLVFVNSDFLWEHPDQMPEPP